MNKLVARIFDALWPRQCHVCECRLLEGEEFLCINCYDSFEPTRFEQNPEDSPLAWMLRRDIDVKKAVAAYYYSPENALGRVLMPMKYEGFSDLCVFMGRKMAEELNLKDVFYDVDVIIPVPLHYVRKHKRGYNQTERIALGIYEVTGIEVDTDVVRRRKNNESQTRMERNDRKKNVESIFKVINPERLHGRHVLLFDDVITTGATINSLAKVITEVAPTAVISVLSLGWTKLSQNNYFIINKNSNFAEDLDDIDDVF